MEEIVAEAQGLVQAKLNALTDRQLAELAELNWKPEILPTSPHFVLIENMIARLRRSPAGSLRGNVGDV